MTAHHRLSMAAWLADNDGVPYAVQHLYDMSEYEKQAAEIRDRTAIASGDYRKGEG